MKVLLFNSFIDKLKTSPHNATNPFGEIVVMCGKIAVMRNVGCLFLVAFMLAGCVANISVPAVKISDFAMDCPQIEIEIANLGDDLELAKAAIAGVLFNRLTAINNQKSIQDRLLHLGALYRQECLN